VTDVITICRRPICLTTRAIFSGSPSSSADGTPLATAQKLHLRVQTSPSIKNVAVPCPKHSPMLGQTASSHTVCRLAVLNRPLSCGILRLPAV